MVPVDPHARPASVSAEPLLNLRGDMPHAIARFASDFVESEVEQRSMWR
jgi:hypothetical protein